MVENAAEILRQTGLWLAWSGGALLSASLVLMIREPLVARAVGGLESMYRWHHRLAVLAYVLLLSHPIALAAAAATHDVGSAWLAISPSQSSPANAIGWIALLGLVAGLATTFMWRLNYGLWRRLHMTLAVAVLLAIAHVFAYRGVEVGSIVLAVPAVLALGWRILRADRGATARPYEVSAVTRLPSATEIVVRPLAAPLTIAPGQFVMAAFFEGATFRGCGEFHPYTVTDTRDDGTLVLAIKSLGDCTQHIQSMESGVAARIQGPFGTFLQGASNRAALWIAGGIGITPFVAVLRAGGPEHDTELLYAYRRAKDALYLPEILDHASRNRRLQFRGFELQEDLRPLLSALQSVPALARRDVHLCGPPPMIDALLAELEALRIPRARIHFERFDFRA